LIRFKKKQPQMDTDEHGINDHYFRVVLLIAVLASSYLGFDRWLARQANCDRGGE
jgi:cytochrome c-type biogenesis protein CcmH/NrfG